MSNTAGGMSCWAPLRGLALSAWLLPAILAILTAAAGENSSCAAESPPDLTELSFDELAKVRISTVYGASKHEQSLAEAPASVTVVSADQIRKSGYRTLGEILNGVRGFYTTWDRAYAYVGVRGFNRPGDYGGRTLITVNGHRLNDPVFDSSAMHADFLLDVDLIDRVEIIRGPGSSLYGNNALFGVVNIVTRRGEDFAGFETSGSYGSYDTYTGRLSYGNRFKNGVELMVSGTYFDSEGHETLHYSEFAHLNGGRVEGNDGLYGGSTFLALSYHGLSLEGGFAAREKRVPTAAWYSAFNDPRAMVFDQRAFASVKLDHQLGTDWLLSTRLYFDHYLYEGASAIPQLDYFDPLYPGLLTVNKDFAHADSIGTESQVSGTLFEHQRLTAGFEYRRDLNITQRNYDVQPHQTYVDVDMATDVFGVFLQDELTITRGLILNAGLRYDNFSSFGETVNPRAALIATPWSHTTVKAIYGQAYRAPNAYELYYEAPRYASNPRLHAETIQTYELALEQTLTTNVLLTASVFRNELEELITFEVDQTGENSRFGNLDHAHATGVETGFEAMTKGARLELSHTYVQTEDANGDPLTNAPEHLGKANLTIPLYAGKLFANFEFLAMSERRTVQDRQTAAHFLFNFTLFSRELLPGLQLSASIYNLLDESYSDPVGSDFLQDRLRQDGRTFRVKLTWNF